MADDEIKKTETTIETDADFDAPAEDYGDEDIVTDDFDETNFDDFEKSSSWTDNSTIKFGGIFVVILIIVGGFVLFGGSSEEAPPSRVSQGSDVQQAPGTEELSPAMRRAVEERNRDEYERALSQGQSTLPTPVDPLRDRLEARDGNVEEQDPLDIWRELQQQPQARQQQQVQQLQQNNEQELQAIENLAGLMQEQMQTVLTARQPKAPQSVTVTSASALVQDDPLGDLGEGTPGELEIPSVTVIPAGEIEYAQLLIEANTDAPGPVLAQIVTGPLAGSRVLGSFEAQDNYLTLTFTTIIVDGESIPVEGIALDPETTLPGVASEIDRRYFTRFILPTAAAFVEGLGRAISEEGQTNVTVSGDTVIAEEDDLDTREELFSAVEEGASELSDLIDEEVDDIEVLIRVEAGTPLGILFLAPVTRPQETPDFY